MTGAGTAAMKILCSGRTWPGLARAQARLQALAREYTTINGVLVKRAEVATDRRRGMAKPWYMED